MGEKVKNIDWTSVEADYRAGIKTLREISAERGPSPAGILKRAKRDGWIRDLSAAIKARAEEKVNRAAVNRKVNKPDEKVIVEANADLQANVTLEHRQNTSAARAVVNGMLGELGLLSDPDVQEGLRIMALGKAREEGGVKAINAMLKAVDAALSLPGRAITVQKLSASLGILIEKERQAHGIDKGVQEDKLATFLKSLPQPPARAAA